MRYLLFAFLLATSQLLSAQTKWDKFYGGSGFDLGKKMLKTADNHLLIASEESSPDGISGINHGNSDILVMKLTMEGDLVWALNVGGDGVEDFGDIVQANDGGFLLVGTTDSKEGTVKTQGGQMDLFLAKISGEGQLEWARSYGGRGNDRGFSVLETYDKGYLLVGEVGSRDGNAVMLPLGGIDGWILKLDGKGRVVWERRYGGASIDRINCILPLSSPDSVMHYYKVIATTMSSDHDLSQNLGGQDIWVFNINEFGRMSGQSKVYGGNMDEDVHTYKMDMKDSSLLITGITYSQNGNIKQQRGMGDVWLLKLNKRGEVLFSETYGGSKQEQAMDILFTEDGGYLLTGMTQSKDGDFILNNGYYDGFILKTNAKGQLAWTKTAGYLKKDFLYTSVQAGKNAYLSVGFSELTLSSAQVMEHSGKYDIWLCYFDDAPQKQSYPATLTGNVIDKTSRKPLKATVKLTNLANLDSLLSVTTNPDDGYFLMVLPKQGKVAFSTLKPGYLYYGDDLDLEVLNAKPNAVIKRNIELEPIRQGLVVQLPQIHFASAKPTYTPESVSELERLAGFMRLNPTVKILISGYASFIDDGTDKINLSIGRANSVRDYLTGRGIAAARIQTEAGDINQQISTDWGAESQSKNRRVELKIMGY